MCRFKSGVIFKNRVVLCPTYNDSHSNVLEQNGIEDTMTHVNPKFVRVELIPPNDDRAIDPKKWRYNVDQDILPDWYKEDPERYEAEFREKVEDWVENNTKVICGKSWLKIKQDGDKTYYLLNGILGRKVFGDKNNYAKSEIREYLSESDLAKDLKKEFGDRIVPHEVNLTSLDGLKDYGACEDDVLSLMTIDLYRECRENITVINTDNYWLATPDSTPSGYGSDYVRCVIDNGCIDYSGCDWGEGVRPFFILKSN